MLIHRRSLLLGLVSSLAAPAIVRAGVIMPVKTMIWDGRVPLTIHNYGFKNRSTYITHAIKDTAGRWQAWDPYRKAYRPVWPAWTEAPLPTALPDYYPAVAGAETVAEAIAASDQPYSRGGFHTLGVTRRSA